MGGISISLCMIVKDEEESLPTCLASVRELVDEMIIIDTGSKDNTKQIASAFTDHVYDFEWIDDFSAARNFAFSKATKEYILWLDADDILTEENKEKFSTLKKELPPHFDSVMMFYHLSFDGNGNPSFSSRRNRLVKREKNFQWIGFVHEYLEVTGLTFQSDIAIHHKKAKSFNDRNLRIYKKALQSGMDFSPRDKYYYANECNDHGLYDDAIQWYRKFLDEGKGWSEDNIQACGKLADCHIQLKDWSSAVQSCLKSFEYDTPRGEICCRLGYIHMEQHEYERSIFWYNLATQIEIPETKSPFIERNCYTWLPHIQLCVCFDRIGKLEEAKRHNELAAEYFPDHPSIDYNRSYFQSIEKKEKS
ncbi:glycosyltransferase [Peribacillus frigoritolerans]|uniref:tetratricopeptide repeat-containing glycosyltransferase family 2 protein n=1 Tax=Peribacillus frigoritolerans TaxID=450367 RepID=UPI00399F2A20